MTSRLSQMGTFCILLVLLTSAVASAEAKWVKLKVFRRFVLYVDSNSVTKLESGEIEVTQKTVLTAEGREYFRRGYKERNIPDPIPMSVVTKERYSKERRHTSFQQMYLAANGDVLLASEKALPTSSIESNSVFESVWLFLFQKKSSDEPETSQHNSSQSRFGKNLLTMSTNC